jgi:hypothetical protein
VAERDPDAEMVRIRRRLEASDELMGAWVEEADRVAKKHGVDLMDLLRDAGMRATGLGTSELQHQLRKKREGAEDD